MPIGATGDVEDLIGFEHAGAWILRIGAGGGQHVEIEANDLARTLDGDARLHPILAGVDVGHERLQSVGDELDGTAELDCRRRRRELVAGAVNLEPKRAADVGRNDLHVVIGEAEGGGEHALDHVRALAAGGNAELAGGRIVVASSERGSKLTAVCRPNSKLSSTI